MDKKIGFNCFLILSAIAFDLTSKRVAIGGGESAHLNHGVLLGAFDGVHAGLVSVVGVLAAGVYVASLFLFHTQRHRKAWIGASLFMGGVLANAVDRLFFGAVTDFIPLPGTEVFFNVADIFQLAGLIIFGMAAPSTYKKMYGGVNKRRLFYRSRFPYARRLVGVVNLMMFIGFVFVFCLNIVFLNHLQLREELWLDWSMLILASYAAAFVFANIFLNLYTKRVFGPIDLVLSGDKSLPLKLRQDDFYKDELEEIQQIQLSNRK